MGHQSLTHERHPRLQMLVEKRHLVGQVGHRHILTGDQITHDFKNIGRMVFGFRHVLAACQAQVGQIIAQLDQGLFVQKATQVMRTK